MNSHLYSKRVFALLFTLLSAGTAPAQQSVYHSAIQATRIYERLLESLLQSCGRIDVPRASPFDAKICMTYRSVPQVVIERAAAATFAGYFSEFEAQQVIEIYTSEPWKSMAGKLIARSRKYEPIPLSPDEEREVAQFLGTPLGTKLTQFDHDPTGYRLVLEAIFQYESRAVGN